jgi:hypothetical protein
MRGPFRLFQAFPGFSPRRSGLLKLIHHEYHRNQGKAKPAYDSAAGAQSDDPTIENHTGMVTDLT